MSPEKTKLAKEMAHYILLAKIGDLVRLAGIRLSSERNVCLIFRRDPIRAIRLMVCSRYILWNPKKGILIFCFLDEVT